jgi:hypothetical protein
MYTIPELSTILSTCQEDVLLKTMKDGNSLLRYNKGKRWMHLKETSLYRSIVFNDAGRMVSFSPPKSVSFEYFQHAFPTDTDWIVEEIVEGTMINLFWNESSNLFKKESAWEISTKSVIGAKTHFDHPINFDELFYSTLKESGCSLNMLDTKYVYSFVLQHVENRIVISLQQSKLYLIAMYELQPASDHTNVCVIDKRLYYDEHLSKKTTIQLPTLLHASNVLQYLVNSKSKTRRRDDYMNVGIMIHDKTTNTRTKILNPSYLEVKALRGNSSNLCYQYLKLKRANQIKQYLHYFPECTAAFAEYSTMIHTLTCQLLEKYRSRFIYKNSDSELFTFPWKQHIYNIHSIYIDNRKNNTAFYVQFKTISDYIKNTANISLLYKTIMKPPTALLVNDAHSNDITIDLRMIF